MCALITSYTCALHHALAQCIIQLCIHHSLVYCIITAQSLVMGGLHAIFLFVLAEEPGIHTDMYTGGTWSRTDRCTNEPHHSNGFM